MRVLADYLDAARKRKGLTSDRALSQELGLSPTMAFQFRTGVQLPSQNVILHLADLAGIAPEIALLEWGAMRAKSTEAEDHWRSLLKMFKDFAGPAALVAGLASAPVEAHETQAVARQAFAVRQSVNEAANNAASVYYGKCRRLWRRLKKAIKLPEFLAQSLA